MCFTLTILHRRICFIFRPASSLRAQRSRLIVTCSNFVPPSSPLQLILIPTIVDYPREHMPSMDDTETGVLLSDQSSGYWHRYNHLQRLEGFKNELIEVSRRSRLGCAPPLMVQDLLRHCDRLERKLRATISDGPHSSEKNDLCSCDLIVLLSDLVTEYPES